MEETSAATSPFGTRCESGSKGRIRRDARSDSWKDERDRKGGMGGEGHGGRRTRRKGNRGTEDPLRHREGGSPRSEPRPGTPFAVEDVLLSVSSSSGRGYGPDRPEDPLSQFGSCVALGCATSPGPRRPPLPPTRRGRDRSKTGKTGGPRRNVWHVTGGEWGGVVRSVEKTQGIPTPPGTGWMEGSDTTWGMGRTGRGAMEEPLIQWKRARFCNVRNLVAWAENPRWRGTVPTPPHGCMMQGKNRTHASDDGTHTTGRRDWRERPNGWRVSAGPTIAKQRPWDPPAGRTFILPSTCPA
eukprot:scaffold431_cov334-Pavlova_lutheri.AAC.58